MPGGITWWTRGMVNKMLTTLITGSPFGLGDDPELKVHLHFTHLQNYIRLFSLSCFFLSVSRPPPSFLLPLSPPFFLTFLLDLFVLFTKGFICLLCTLNSPLLPGRDAVHGKASKQRAAL